MSDNGSPPLSSSTRVVVSVNDVNDHSPEFLERFYKVQIPSTLVSNDDTVLMQVWNIFHYISLNIIFIIFHLVKRAIIL